MTRTKPWIQGSLIACLIAASAATAVHAEDLTMWVRESAADPGKLMVDLWNTSHEDKITLTAIPDNQVVTKLATSAQSGRLTRLGVLRSDLHARFHEGRASD